MTEENTERLVTYVGPTLHRKFRVEAAEEGVSVAALLRRLVNEHLIKKEQS